MVERSMDIWSFDKLFIFIIFVVPGFISIKVYEALHPSVKRESSKIIIDAVAYSCINYAIWFFRFIPQSGITYLIVHCFYII